MSFLTPARQELFKRVIGNTQFDLTILLENVHDAHNIGAVLRSCDAVGLREVYVLDTDDNLKDRVFQNAMSTSTGVKKWIKVNRFVELGECMTVLRKKYSLVLATHLGHTAESIYSTNLTGSLAIVFGNEHAGISSELVEECDGNILIPQMGMVQSLNISVACAVTLFEVARQRIEKGLYSSDFDPNNGLHQQMMEEYIRIHEAGRRQSSSS